MTLPPIKQEVLCEEGVRVTRVYRDDCAVAGLGGDPFNALNDLLEKEKEIQRRFDEAEQV